MSFKISSRFHKAAAVINKIPVDKFPLVINRILQKLHIKNARFFSTEEEEQLRELFGLSMEKLQLAIDACCYIFEQAAFTSTGPEPLFEILLEAGFEQTHAKVLGRTWASEAAEYISRVKAQTSSVGFSALKSVDFHLGMNLAQADLTRQQEPCALFELTVDHKNASPAATPSSSSSVAAAGASARVGAHSSHGGSSQSISEELKAASRAAGSNEEKLCLEFSHEELYAFFGQLERMQKQLDALSAT